MLRSGRVLFVLAVVVSAGGAFAAEAPVAVSPGHASKLALTGDACPTFSWGQVEGAKSYQLIVYRLGDEGEEAKPVLRETFAGSASGWTPSLDRCLERGGQYAWSVRALDRKQGSEWSQPNLFEVASGPSEAEFEEAIQVVRQYLVEEEATRSGDLASRGGGPLSGAISATAANLSARRSTADPSPLSAVVGDSALQVNGSAVVTVATLAGALCSATEVRFLDQGDGTVLDCNTGKIWLKHTSCVGKDTWNEVDGTSIFTKVTDLNNGMDFGCVDYTAGTYTDWEVPAMTDLCGLWDGTCSSTGCCTASMGIVDDSHNGPAVANAQDDSQWMPEDAFVSVQSNYYWSATAGGPNAANSSWNVGLNIGDLGKANATNIERFVWPVRGGQ